MDKGKGREEEGWIKRKTDRDGIKKRKMDREKQRRIKRKTDRDG